jgi:multidrug efflux pump subunit AcrA (membrane-fusion protein)
MELAKISADRWENLRKTDSVSAQEADQQTSGYKQSQANLAAADANVRRLEQLEGFKNVYAPFSGVLTRRNVDPGALINAGAGAAGRELFDLARVDPLRVYTSVPQAYAPYIKVGAKPRSLCRNSRPEVFRRRWREPPKRSTRPRAPCSPKSTCPTRMGACCPARSARCTSPSAPT